MQRLTSLFSFIGRLVHVDISLSFEAESNNAFSISAEVEISLSVVKQLTENEYVWSLFYDCPIPVGKLKYSHDDTNGVAGYRVAGTNMLVWKDQLSYVDFVV